KRPEELEKLEKLGWIMLDHGDAERNEQGQVKPSKTKKLGTMTALGPFYPPMLDAVLLTRGDYMIGMANSRMSQLARQRGSACRATAPLMFVTIFAVLVFLTFDDNGDDDDGDDDDGDDDDGDDDDDG
ncbi:hypothetical protein BGX24_010474, partial [Mortierella sp. AD032]